MQTSPIGRAAISAREGCRLSAYRDSVGVLTIGVGHTGRAAPPPVTAGMTITQAEADTILAEDLAPIEAAVNAAVEVALADHEFDALASLAFNIGAHGFQGSTVVRKLNAGDRAGAADAFCLWERPASLTSRREAERKQFLTPYATSLPVARVGEVPIKSAPIIVPPIAGPHLLPTPAKQTWSAWLGSLFSRKAA